MEEALAGRLPLARVNAMWPGASRRPRACGPRRGAAAGTRDLNELATSRNGLGSEAEAEGCRAW